MNNVYDELQARGLINQQTSDNIKAVLQESQTVYCGFDPTGDSLHVGHLLPIVILKHFENYGHKNIAVVGGATGLIGDPSGKKQERVLNTKETVLAYSDLIKTQLVKYLNKDNTTFVNNIDWFGKLSAIDFLRDFGKNFGINYMINKDSVASRLESGLSYTEFSYTIIQAMDFAHLYENYNCKFQIGGSDQWGNITSGLELIRKRNEASEAYGITVPLVTKSDGTKFGKTEGGAIWLESEKTSPYDFYQFFVNTEDKDVIKYLKTFTFLPLEEIAKLEQSLQEKPFLREAQKALAKELTIFVHGTEALTTVLKISEVLFSGNLQELTGQQIRDNFKTMDQTIVNEELNIIDLLIKVELASSKREAREFINNQAIKVNGEVINDENQIITKNLAIENEFYLIKRGKKKYAFIKYE
ncbi:MAG: tyrosine--tRNA ligase [Mycoplasmatales bacterium]